MNLLLWEIRALDLQLDRLTSRTQGTVSEDIFGESVTQIQVYKRGLYFSFLQVQWQTVLDKPQQWFKGHFEQAWRDPLSRVFEL